ncbi:MAG: TIGR04086 family membrane protein [Aquaticitalea sp.]
MKSQYINIQNKIPRISRISWGAILAGTLTAIVVAFLLNMLGLGIGLTTIDPMTEANPLDGLGTGTIVWWALANLAALFIGGMVAGRMSGLPSNSDGGLHGFLAWGLYLLISIQLVTSTIGGIFNGMASAASSVFSDSTATNVAQALQDAKDKGSEDTTFSIEKIKKEALQLIEKAEKRNILPDDASEETKGTLNEAQRDSRAFINDLNLDENIDEFFNDISVDLDDNGNLTITADGADEILNREDIKNYLVQNTELSEAEINGVIEKWNNKIDTAVNKAERYYEKAKTKAIRITDEAADAAGKYSIILFFLFLLGAGAAFAGGAVGSPYLTVEEEHIEDTI